MATRRDCALSLAALLWIVVFAVPAAADLAVEPGDFVTIQQAVDAPTTFALRGMQLVPDPSIVPGWQGRIVQLFNESSTTATLVAERLAIEDPAGSGAGAFYCRVGGAGSGNNDVTVRDSTVRHGGAANLLVSAFTCECPTAGLCGDYQTTQRCSGGLTMAAPALQAKACWNSGAFDSGPITRYLAVGWGSALTI